MKYIINLKHKEELQLNDIEDMVRRARNSSDYIDIHFGNKGEFLKVAFCKDGTYCIGYNFWNMEFAVKLNILFKQMPKTINGKIASFITTWINRLNKK